MVDYNLIYELVSHFVLPWALTHYGVLFLLSIFFLYSLKSKMKNYDNIGKDFINKPENKKTIPEAIGVLAILLFFIIGIMSSFCFSIYFVYKIFMILVYPSLFITEILIGI